MQAIRAHEFGNADVLIVEDVPTPQPRAGEILIRVEAASVNYADLIRRQNGPYPFPTKLPFVPGSEVAGTVAAHGDGVSQPPLGTPVFSLVGTGAAVGSTGYAEYAIADARQVIPIPPGVSPETACGLVVAGTTAMLMLRDVARVQKGDRVLVQGAAGAVGSLAIQIARHLGATNIIGAASTSAKRDAARRVGADHVVDYTDDGWPDQVRALTNGDGVDIILEMRGGTSLEESLSALAPFGRVVVYGMASGDAITLSPRAIFDTFHVPALNHALLVFNLGLWFGMRPAAAVDALSALIGLVAQGKVTLPVHERLPLARAADAHRLLESRRAIGKIVLTPSTTT